MIDIILTTLTVIATVAGALVAMWLSALGSAGRSRQGGTFHLRAKAGHRDDGGAHRGRDLRGIGKSPW